MSVGEQPSRGTALIVVTYNRDAKILALLNQILALPHSGVDEIIVVDNHGSTYLRERISAFVSNGAAVTLIVPPFNAGPAGGHWLGIAHAMMNGHEFVALTDDDDFPQGTSAIQQTTSLLKRTQARQPSAIAVGSAGATMSKGWRLVSTIGCGGRDGDVREVDYLAGGYLPAYRLIPDLLDAFDPCIWFGFEELSAAITLRSKGWLLYSNENLRVNIGFPTKSETANNRPAWREYCSSRNRLLIAVQCRASIKGRIWIVAQIILPQLWRTICQPSLGNGKRLRARVAGVRDGVRGVCGPPPFSTSDVQHPWSRSRSALRGPRAETFSYDLGRSPQWVSTASTVCLITEAADYSPRGVRKKVASLDCIIDSALESLHISRPLFALDATSDHGSFGACLRSKAIRVVSIRSNSDARELIKICRFANRESCATWRVATSLEDVELLVEGQCTDESCCHRQAGNPQATQSAMRNLPCGTSWVEPSAQISNLHLWLCVDGTTDRNLLTAFPSFVKPRDSFSITFMTEGKIAGQRQGVLFDLVNALRPLVYVAKRVATYSTPGRGTPLDAETWTLWRQPSAEI